MVTMQYRKVEEIAKLEGNPRKIQESEVKRLMESIQRLPDYFEAHPIVLSDRTGKLVVIDGNQRLEASKRLGLKEVPTALMSGLTEEREREIILRANVLNGEWDLDALQEWDKTLLEESGLPEETWKEEEEQKEAEEDNFTEEDAEKAEARVKPGEVWKLGEHRLMCGDSTDIQCVKTLTGGVEMDLCVTDPPYNVAYEGGTKDKLKIANDNMSETAFLSFLTAAFAAMTSVLKEGASYYCWYASRTHISFEQALIANGLNVKQQLIWNKNTFTLGRQDYQWKHEPCMYGWKEGAAHYFVDDRTLATVMEDSQSLDFSKMKKSELLDYIKEINKSKVQTTILNEDKPSVNGEHPTMKPVKLIGRQVRNSSRVGENVIDLFGGSGTTLIACEQLNRKCFMMEYDPHYCDVIIARWEKLTGKKAERIEE